MTSPDTGAHGVVAVVPQAGRLLVIRRSQFVRAPGAYCFPGGNIEAGEQQEAALVRELAEELSAVVRPQVQLWTSTTSWGVRLAWWQCQLLVAGPLRPDAAEVQSFEWLTPADLRVLPGLLESNLHFLDAWQDGAFTLR